MCDRLAIEQILDNLVSNAIKYGAGQPIMVTASEEPSLHQLIVEVRDGVRLLHRTTRCVQLTEHGRAFHARARDLLAEVDDLHSMFAGDSVALRGRLRVDLPTEVARNETETASLYVRSRGALNSSKQREALLLRRLFVP